MTGAEQLRVLVTGGTGFLGSKIVCALAQRGFDVWVLKRQESPTGRLTPIIGRIHFVDRDGSAVAAAFEQCRFNVIVHAATCYGRRGESAAQIAETNLLFPLRLLEAGRANGATVFLNIDTSLPRTLNDYALSKKQFAEWGQRFAEGNDLRFLNVELEHFYGAGDAETKFTTHVIRQCANNAAELRLTDGEQQRDFIYVDDAVDACLLVMQRASELQPGYHNFAVGSGRAIRVREFVELVKALTQCDTALRFGALPRRAGEPLKMEADLSAMKALGWQPRVELRDGIRLVLDREK